MLHICYFVLMKILSINVSEPKKITFNGKELITSIYKIPVNKAVNLTELGLEGDRQADLQVHGGYDKAVYAYSHKHYDYWSGELGESFTDYGLVGENLTIDDFDEKDINIGDVLEIGDTRLQISQPRIPCYKVGIKMNKREFPKIFSKSGLLGSYLRVIQEGTINIGDEIKIIRNNDQTMSVFDIAKLLFDDINNKDEMKMALGIKLLSEEVKEKFRERLMKMGDFDAL